MPEMQTAARPQPAAGPASVGELAAHRSVWRRVLSSGALLTTILAVLEHIRHLRAIVTAKGMGTVTGASEDAG